MSKTKLRRVAPEFEELLDSWQKKARASGQNLSKVAITKFVGEKLRNVELEVPRMTLRVKKWQ